jgi:hypothetical protein
MRPTRLVARAVAGAALGALLASPASARRAAPAGSAVPVTQRTEVRLLSDGEALYVGAHPRSAVSNWI